MQDNGKPVKGHASHMHYELAKDLVILTGNAYGTAGQQYQRRQDHLSGERAENAGLQRKGKRVTTVLVPSQLQDKNNGQAPAKKRVTNSLWQL